MRKSIPVVEWYIAESDADWERQRMLLLPEIIPAAHPRLYLKHAVCGVMALLFLLVGWQWYTTADKKTTTPSSIGVTSSFAESSGQPSRSDQGLQHGQAVKNVESPVHVFEAAQPFEMHGELAVARVVMHMAHGGPAYRQTRFFRRIDGAWRRTELTAALWGPERTLATPSFVFRFRQHDAATVIAVAPQIEVLYTTLRRSFGLPISPTPEKQAIEVSVTQRPGLTRHAPALIVPSPVVYLAPVGFSDADLLAQSIALPLLDQVIDQASEQYAFGATWQPMARALRLWQVWELNLPLAVWQNEMVQWLYVDLPAASPGQTDLLPNRYPELCAAHKLWMPSPVQIDIPIACAEREQEAAYFRQWSRHAPPTHLEQLTVPVPLDEELTPASGTEQVNQLGQTVALAVLIEYAVATYGQERMPVLVAGLGQSGSWETLIPAVYGVSASEFEDGWQLYLATRYGVPFMASDSVGRDQRFDAPRASQALDKSDSCACRHGE
jgi:hypothetical protein